MVDFTGMEPRANNRSTITTPIRVPEALPFLESLSWFDRDWRSLGLLDMLRRYEAGWRQRGVIADPSTEELDFVRQLARRFGSFLDV